MAEVPEMLGGLGSMGSIALNAVFIIFGVIVVGLVIGGTWWFVVKKKKWNLKVEIKITRSDGNLVDAEWGKGQYNIERGVVWIKRNKRKAIAMKPFDTDKYLQGASNILTVRQVSPGHYIPVLPKSYLTLVDDKTGEEADVITVRADFSESKSWKNQFERQSKGAYTIVSLLQQYASFIGIGIVLFMNFAGFAILYSKVA